MTAGRTRHAAAVVAAVLSAFVVSALVPAPSAAAAAANAALPLSATDQYVHDRLGSRSDATRLGNDLAGEVVDVETGQVLWSHRPVESQLPASTVKLLTAVTALQSFGPEHRFTTQVTTGATGRRVVLVGGGDPMLARAQLRRLARSTAAALSAQGLLQVRLDVDDSLFPAPTTPLGWRSSYLLEHANPVRALVVDGHRRWDTALDAGRIFAGMLERQGLRVGRVARATRPVEATTIAAVRGYELADQVGHMLRTSDNDVAEILHRQVALQTGYPATWAGAADAQVAALAGLGVTVAPGRVHDGSGLSRADRLHPREVVQVLRKAFDPAYPHLASLQSGALAVAGVSGTLGPSYLRYDTNPTKCAVGLIEAKTGSLRGAIALSGYALGADGRVKAFSFLLNQVPSTLTTRRAVDRLAATVTGCW